jgi:hypothetical protein
VRIWGVEQDRTDFAAFYAATRDDCLRIVLVNVGDQDLAEDLVAEGFTRAWTPTTYLPVRMYGSNETFGGRWPRTTSSGVTDVQWLPPTAANVAKTLVTIPPGFRQVASAADQ